MSATYSTANNPNEDALTQSNRRLRRARRLSYRRQTELKLSELEITAETAEHISEMKEALLLWAAFMMEISPEFLSRFYVTINKEWSTHARGILYKSDDDERDETSVKLHTIFLRALAKAQGQYHPDWDRDYSASQIKSLRSVLDETVGPCLRLSQQLAKSDEGGVSETRTSNVLQFREFQARKMNNGSVGCA